jgi:hypothetical protein
MVIEVERFSAVGRSSAPGLFAESDSLLMPTCSLKVLTIAGFYALSLGSRCSGFV